MPPGMAFTGLTGLPPKIAAASWPHARHLITSPPIWSATLPMTPMMLRRAGSLLGPMTKSGPPRA